ncbi:MAG: hypothetical protein RLO51_16875 [Thalassobaculum sp.]|uniref:hypothetical protein n=1 Tax=Thalassobaculum sp. TaxID=2022740 RepID=UPI0032EAE12E
MTQQTMRLSDSSMLLLDALGAIQLAVDGLDDDATRRSMAFLVEKVGEIATEIDDIARHLHCGVPDDPEPSPDDDLLSLISMWRTVNERVAETDGTPDHAEHVERSHRLLAKIAKTEALTFRGALAKARLQWDDDEIARSMRDDLPLEVVGAAGLRDLFKVTATA